MTQPAFPAFHPPQRVLLGPGPSDVAPAVLAALARPTIGHLDPELLRAMDELRAMLRTLFGTSNAATLAISGTGTAGMEAVLANLIEPGDGVLVPVHGYFGARVAEIAARCGAEVVRVDGEWGKASDATAARAACVGRSIRLVAVVHAETSTGVRLELAPWSELARGHGALLAADCVTSLGCIPVELDRQGVDAAWSCSQKGLSCTPGLAPVSFSPRAVERIRARTRKVQSLYLDLQLLLDFWSEPHGYHHTISSNLVCALHEACRLLLERGLDARYAQIALHSKALCAGVAALDMELVVAAEQRLPQLNVVRIPAGVDDLALRKQLLAGHGIEIGGGLGAFKGKVWRLGLMGAGANERNVLLVLAALRDVLGAHGADPLAAAQRIYDSAR